MNTEDIAETTPEPQQIDSGNTHEEVDTTLIEPIEDKYGRIQALCDQLSHQSKPFSHQANALLTEATALYDEAQRLTPNYKPPKNNTPQV